MAFKTTKQDVGLTPTTSHFHESSETQRRIISESAVRSLKFGISETIGPFWDVQQGSDREILLDCERRQHFTENSGYLIRDEWEFISGRDCS